MEQPDISKKKNVEPKIVLKETEKNQDNKIVKEYLDENFKYPNSYDKKYWDKNLKWTFQNL